MEQRGTVPLSSRRLILRPFSAEDAPAMYRNWVCDPEVTEFLRWPAHGDLSVTESVLNSWLPQYADPRFYQWAIVPKELGEPIGSISAVGMTEETGTVHIGCCIGKKWWHKGYTSEALQTVLPFFFQQVKANRLESQHDPDNPHSGDVMKKCGLRYEGTLRRADWSNRGIVDACMYSILAEELEQ